jgi:hypothetical protein
MNFAMLDVIPFPAAQNAPTNLASVHALVGDEGLGVVLELVGIAEGDPGERSACGRNG